jgi:hypothetical protein
MARQVRIFGKVHLVENQRVAVGGVLGFFEKKFLFGTKRLHNPLTITVLNMPSNIYDNKNNLNKLGKWTATAIFEAHYL